jgi:midasin (ATPase involved in ribosome maturation)
MNNSKKYKYSGKNICRSFRFRGTEIVLDEVTDKQIEKLLKESSEWDRYFKKKPQPKQKKIAAE